MEKEKFVALGISEDLAEKAAGLKRRGEEEDVPTKLSRLLFRIK